MSDEGFPRGINLDLDELIAPLVNRIVVHLNDRFAFFGVGLFRGGFHQLFRFGIRDDLFVEFEECRLHDGVDASTKPEFFGQPMGIDDKEICIAFGQDAFHFIGHQRNNFCFATNRVEQERTTRAKSTNQVILLDIGITGTRDKVRIRYQVRGANRTVAKSQVHAGDTTRFFRVVTGIRLPILRSIITNDGNGVFAGSDGSVRPQTKEQQFGNRLVFDLNVWFVFERLERNVIDDANGKSIDRGFVFQVGVHRRNLFWRHVFAGKTITSPNDFWRIFTTIKDCSYIQIQRFPKGTLFFGAVQDSNSFHTFRNCFIEILFTEGSIQVNDQQSHFFPCRHFHIDDFFGGFVHGPHRDDDVGGLRVTIVNKRRVMASCLFTNFLHVIIDDIRNRIPKPVLRFGSLEVDVIVLSTTSGNRVGWIQCPFAKLGNGLAIEQSIEHAVVHDFNLLNFMGRSKSIEEMHERNSGFDCCQVSNPRQVHDFLNR